MNRELSNPHKKIKMVSLAAVMLTSILLAAPGPSRAASTAGEVVAAGSVRAENPEISLYGILGQTLPSQALVNAEGKRLIAGNLLMHSGISAFSEQNCDGDELKDTEDAFPGDPHETLDTDNDGTGNNTDPDDDNDGTLDKEDAFPTDSGESLDNDNDGYGNNSDTDDDNDAVSDDEENAGPGNGDGNGDGIKDNLQFNVATFKAVGDSGYTTLESSSGTTLTGCEPAESPSPDDEPEDLKFPMGFFNFTMENTGDKPVTLTIYLPEGVHPDTYYKYGRTPDDNTDHWYEFMYDGRTGAVIEGNVITLHFVDAERGDDVLTKDGIVIDLGGPGFEPNGGGCFIGSLMP